MSGITSYGKIDQSYELDVKNGLRLNVQEISEDGRNDDVQPMLSEQRATHSDTLPPTQWPYQAGTLVEDPRWELLYDLYDSFLLIVAIVLILKTSLCIYAWNHDKMFRGKYLDAVSPLTLRLIEFNEQVSNS